MADNSNYQLATPEEFNKFRSACDSTENWNLCHEEGEDLKVWDQKVEGASINIVKLFAKFKGVPAEVMYDTLHDPDYRKDWDENMIEGYNICQLGPCDDIGYYSAKTPIGIANRDFVNQRSWDIFNGGKEFIIMNSFYLYPKHNTLSIRPP
jgi:hypothetical protein